MIDQKLVVEVMHDTQLLDSSLVLKLEATAVFSVLIDNLEKLIPGDQTALATTLKELIKLKIS